jgi:hypothetical protein
VSSGQYLRFEGSANLVGMNVAPQGFQFRFSSELQYFDAETRTLIAGDEFWFLRETSPGDEDGLARVDILGTDLDSFRIVGRRSEPSEVYRRGDADGNGQVELTNAVGTLGFLFQGFREPACLDAADSNDSGVVDIGDAINTLNVLFLGTGEIPTPGILECGVDPTDDALSCDAYDTCE